MSEEQQKRDREACLTDEEILAAFPAHMGAVRLPAGWREFARAIEAKVLSHPAPASQPVGEAVAHIDRDAVFAAMYERDPYWDAQDRSSAAAVRLALDVLARSGQPAQEG